MAPTSSFAQFMAGTKADSGAPAPDDDKEPLRQTVQDLQSHAAHDDQPEPAEYSSAPSPVTAPAPSSLPVDSPFYPHAERILTPAPITQDQKADAFDHFYAAKTPQELSTRLQALGLPAEVHSALVDAKTASMPVKSHMDKIVEAVNKLAAMNPQLREIGESHPALLKAFLAGD